MKNNYKWLLIALLSCAFFFHQADRALFGLLTVPIQNDLHLTNGQIGWINTVLSWTLAAMTTVAGFIGDRFSRKWIITVSLIFWSLMTVMMGFTGDWHILGFAIPAFLTVMFFRSIATGGGESFYAPSAYALIAGHHKETRSLALSIHQAALYVGLMCSGALVAAALTWLGSWRYVFMVFGGAGFLLGIVFIFALRDEKGVGKELVKMAEAPAQEKASLVDGLRAYFCNPSALFATAGFIAIVFVNNAYLFWVPKFMAEKFRADYILKLGLSPETAGSAEEITNAIVGAAGAQTMLWHHLVAFAAIMAGGVLTDRFVRKYPRFRLGFQIVALVFGAPAIVAIGFAPSIAATITMTAVYGIFRGGFEVNTHASLFDVVDPRHRSTAVGLLNMLAFFFGGLSGWMIGKMSERWGVRGFEYSFVVMGGAYLLAAFLMALSFFFTFKRNRVVESA